MKKSLIILFLLIPGLLFATRHYIDPAGDDGTGDGSIGNPWASLDFACTQVVSPDTIYVNPGNYTEPDRCELAVGVSIYGAGNTSNIVCTYVAGVNSYRDASITLASVVEGTNGNQSISYIRLDGSNLTATKAISVVARSNVKIHHCTIVDFENGGIYLGGNLGVIHTPPTTYSTGNQIYSDTISNCSTRNPTRGISAAGGGMGCIDIGGQTNMLIYNNIIADTSRVDNCDIIDGAEGNCKNSKIYNNVSYKPLDSANVLNELYSFHYEIWDVDGGLEVYNNTFHGGYSGIDLGGFYAVKGDSVYSWYIHNNSFLQASLTTGSHYRYAIDIEGNANDIIVAYNYIQNYSFGIIITLPNYVASPWVSSGHKIYYNIFENIGFSNFAYGAGIFLSNDVSNGAVDNIDIYNNVMTAKTGSNRPYAGVYAYTGSFDNDSINHINIKNNIIKDFQYGPVIFDNGPHEGKMDNVDVQYNDFHDNVGSNDVALWGGIIPTNYTDANNITTDPLFVGGLPYDFSLQAGSPCINTGIGVGLSVDYLGYLLDANPDMGVYEYGAGGYVPPDPPTVTTTTPVAKNSRATIGGGNVTSDGGGTISARGICWTVTPNPDITDNKTINGTGTGAFISWIGVHNANDTIHVRSYATNQTSTSYGEDIEWYTPNSVYSDSLKVGPTTWIDSLFVRNDSLIFRTVDGKLFKIEKYIP